MGRFTHAVKKAAKAAAAILLTAALTACSGSLNADGGSQQGEVEHAKPPFWVVTDPQSGATIYMLGSIHAGKKEVQFPDYVIDAYKSSSFAAPELDTVAFQTDIMLQSQAVSLLTLKEGTAADYIGSDYDDTVKFFKEKGVYQMGMDKMIPFYWSSAVSSLVISGSGLDVDYGTESVILQMAHKDGKEIREMEGALSQYAMMADIPMSVQTELLQQCVGDQNVNLQAISTAMLYDAWRSFDEDYFKAAGAFDTSTVDNPSDWEEYYRLMYTDRQKKMADKITQWLQDGEQGFVFVGALHYYAEPSILSLLEEAGYSPQAVTGGEIISEEAA